MVTKLNMPVLEIFYFYLNFNTTKLIVIFIFTKDKS